MAIDYNKRQKPTPEEPPAPAAAPPTGPSWYRRPEDDEPQPPTAAVAPPAPPAHQPPAPPAPPAWQPPPTPAAPPAPPAWQPPVAPPAPPAWQPPPTPAASPSYQQSPAAQPPTGPGVSLSKVTLSKSAPSVSLSKTGGGSGIIRVNLNWTAAAKSGGGGGFLRRLAGGGGGVDLDLGCLYELSDGRKGVVQALGNAFGSLHAPPFIQLDGDDRTGSVIAGETMQINLAPGRFRRILIFAFIYEGAPNWAAANGVVTLTPVQGPQVEVTLDATSGQARSCAIAQLIDQGGDLVVQREVQYINGGQSKIDAAYNWGMDWSPGRK